MVKLVRNPLVLQKLVTSLIQKQRFASPGIDRKKLILRHFKNILKVTYLSSLSSSPNWSRNTAPQTHARFPLTTMIVEELTDKKIPVPPPHSWE